MATPINVTYTGPSPIHAGNAPSTPDSPVIAGDFIVAGDSLTDLLYPSGGYRAGLPLTMYPPRVIWNGGIQSNTIANLVNRLQAMIDAHPTADTYIIRIGTNGPGVGTYQERFSDLFAILATNNKFGIFHSIPPRGAGSAGVASGFVAENAWLKAQCESSPSTLAYVEDSQDLGDADYNAIASYYIENGAGGQSDLRVHMNSKGVLAQGVRMALRYLELLEHVSPLISDPGDIYPANPASTQWVQNPFMSGTGGVIFAGGTGTLPSEWVSQSYTSSSWVHSIVASDDSNPTPWMRTTLNASSAGDISIKALLGHPAIAADMSVFKRFDMVAEVRLVDIDTAAMRGVSLNLDVGNSFKAQCGFPMADSGVINKRLVLRGSLQRDQGGSASTVAVEGFSAGALTVGIWLSFLAFSAPIGSVDIRLVSVKGSAT